MKYIRTICLLICTILFTNTYAQHQFTKSIHRSFSTANIKSLKVKNMYGNIRIVQTQRDSVFFNIKVSVDIHEKRRSKKLLQEIYVMFGNYNKQVSAKTKISEHLNNVTNFSIDYIISVPKKINLLIDNCFGNIIAEGNLNNYSEFILSYGNIYVDNLIPVANEKKNYFKLHYSTAHLKNIYNSKILTNYSKIHVKQANNMLVSSQCSRIEVDSTSSYISNTNRDNLIIKRCSSFEIKKGINSHINIENGIKYANMKLKDGSLNIKNISDFKNITLDIINTNIKLDIPKEYSYTLQAEFLNTNYTLPEKTQILFQRTEPGGDIELIEAKCGKEKEETISTLRIRANKGSVKFQENNYTL